MEEYSYSRLTRFIDCPLSYMRKYLNAEVPESHGITEGGLFMHNLLEMYERGKIDKDGMIDYFKNYDNVECNVGGVSSFKCVRKGM